MSTIKVTTGTESELNHLIGKIEAFFKLEHPGMFKENDVFAVVKTSTTGEKYINHNPRLLPYYKDEIEFEVKQKDLKQWVGSI